MTGACQHICECECSYSHNCFADCQTGCERNWAGRSAACYSCMSAGTCPMLGNGCGDLCRVATDAGNDTGPDVRDAAPVEASVDAPDVPVVTDTGGTDARAPGTPVMVSTGAGGPLATDGHWVYFSTLSSTGSRGISRIASTGGAVQVVISGIEVIDGMAADATHVYWGHSLAGRIHRVPGGGGAAQDVITVVASLGTPAFGRFYVDNGYVYYTQAGSPPGVYRVPVGGGTPEAIRAMPPSGWLDRMTFDDQYLYWPSAGITPSMGAGVLRMAKAGGAPALAVRMSAPAMSYVSVPLVAGTQMAWIAYTGSGMGNAVIGSGTLGSTGDSRILDRGESGSGLWVVPGQIGTDGTFVYYLTGGVAGNCRVMRAPLDGSGAASVVANCHDAYAMSVTREAVYWVGDEGGLRPLMRVGL